MLSLSLYFHDLLPSTLSFPSDEDDLYLLYATLFSEPSTFLVTNDLQGCNKHRLPVGCHDTFQQWLRRRLANIIRVGGSIKIKVRVSYKETKICLLKLSPLVNSGTVYMSVYTCTYIHNNYYMYIYTQQLLQSFEISS